MMRIALGLQYDGGSYSGWQSQAKQKTVQGELENALVQFIGVDKHGRDPVRVITAGRTDAGVHALGQVVHFDTPVKRESFSWVRGVNCYLPSSIVVNWAQPVTSEFSARFSACERTYLYALYAGPSRSPMADGRAGYLMLPPELWFDLEAMKQAAQYLIGEHDFSSFRSSECQSKTPVKTIYSIDIFADQPWLYFKIRGNAFLHHMVRNLVGSFLQIGLGKQSAQWMQTLLLAKNRSLAAPTFSPAGLYLVKVAYPEEFDIPQPYLANSWLPKYLL